MGYTLQVGRLTQREGQLFKLTFIPTGNTELPVSLACKSLDIGRTFKPQRKLLVFWGIQTMNLFGISITYLAQNAGLDNDPSSMLFCGYFNTAAAVSTRANVPWRELTAERQQFWRYFTLQHKKTFNLKFFTLHLQA